MEEFFVLPRGLGKIINYIKNKYHNKPMCTENGYASPLHQGVQDMVHDVQRIDYQNKIFSNLLSSLNSLVSHSLIFWSLIQDAALLELMGNGCNKESASGISQLEKTLEVYEAMKSNSLEPILVNSNALADMYESNGHLVEAWEVLHYMGQDVVKPNIASVSTLRVAYCLIRQKEVYSSEIGAYSKQGKFKVMLAEKFTRKKTSFSDIFFFEMVFTCSILQVWGIVNFDMLISLIDGYKIWRELDYWVGAVLMASLIAFHAWGATFDGEAAVKEESKMEKCEKNSALFVVILSQRGLACVQLYVCNVAAELFKETRTILEAEYAPYHHYTIEAYSNLVTDTYDARGKDKPWDNEQQLKYYAIAMHYFFLIIGLELLIDDKKDLGLLTSLMGIMTYFCCVHFNFRVEFDEFFMDGVISEIEIGLGPCGELRHPSYPAKRDWKYPGIGEFQCYDQYLMKSLKKAAETRGHSFWGKGPKNAGLYNSRPHETRFFCDGGDYDSYHGRFFLNWYSQVFTDHGDRVLALANLAFEGTFIAAKLSCIHWWYKTASHAAELTAGFYNPCNQDGYAQIASMFKKHGAALKFTCAEFCILANMRIFQRH